MIFESSSEENFRQFLDRFQPHIHLSSDPFWHEQILQYGLIDFNGIRSHLLLFYALRLGNCILLDCLEVGIRCP